VSDNDEGDDDVGESDEEDDVIAGGTFINIFLLSSLKITPSKMLSI
jgi:hypothetical protein